jgi:hypothetical protein
MFQLLKVGESGRFSHHSYRVELRMSNENFIKCINGEMHIRGALGDMEAKSLHSVFVHELSHFWQIASTRSTLMLMIYYWMLLRDLCGNMKGIISLPLKEPLGNPHYQLIRSITREIEGVAIYHLWESAALYQQFCFLKDGDINEVRSAFYEYVKGDEGLTSGLYTRAFLEFDHALGGGNYELTDFPVLVQIALNEPSIFINGEWEQLHPVVAFRLLVRLFLAANRDSGMKGVTYESFLDYLKTSIYKIKAQPAFDDDSLFLHLDEISDLSPKRSQQELVDAYLQGTFTVCNSPLEIMLPFIPRMKKILNDYGMESFIMPVWHHGHLVHSGIEPPATINLDPETGFAVQATVPKGLPPMVAMFSDFYESCMGLLFGLIGTPEPQFLCPFVDCEYRNLLLCNRHLNIAQTKEGCFFPQIVEKYSGIPITNFVRQDKPTQGAQYSIPKKSIIEFDCTKCGGVILFNPDGAGAESFKLQTLDPDGSSDFGTSMVFVSCPHCKEPYWLEKP